jgi:hypothetical protein
VPPREDGEGDGEDGFYRVFWTRVLLSFLFLEMENESKKLLELL